LSFVLRHFLPLLLAAASVPAVEAPPDIPREFRGAWVATVFNLNWPSKPGLSAADQQQELRAILDRAADLRLNAILLQVRPSCDAFYNSKLEPWSAFLTGKMGRPPEPLYDPLAFAIEQAHARGLELHAWFNPFRALASSNTMPSANHVTQTHPEWIRHYGSLAVLDPGEPAAREYVRNVILDVVRRYDVDGIHIDDYFYPYPIKDRSGGIVPFPDAQSWNRYRAGQGTLALDDWRRDNINQFVKSLYLGIKDQKRWVKFGISPFGIWRPHVPETIEAQLDSYAQLYADSRRWLMEGWCDYFSPQLYWSISPAQQSFPVLLDWWRTQNRQHRHVWPGLADDRIGPSRSADEIAHQIEIVRSASAGATSVDPGGAGELHWDARSLLRDRGGVYTLLRSHAYAEPALVPASPWLGSTAPAPPEVHRETSRVTWKNGGEIPACWWAVQVKQAGHWSFALLPAATMSVPIDQTVEAVAVRSIDLFGNASPPAH
jgi:uncharacterized lipoprotein YddW (UPF0748 family)